MLALLHKSQKKHSSMSVWQFGLLRKGCKKRERMGNFSGSFFSFVSYWAGAKWTPHFQFALSSPSVTAHETRCIGSTFHPRLEAKEQFSRQRKMVIKKSWKTHNILSKRVPFIWLQARDGQTRQPKETTRGHRNENQQCGVQKSYCPSEATYICISSPVPIKCERSTII